MALIEVSIGAILFRNAPKKGVRRHAWLGHPQIVQEKN